MSNAKRNYNKSSRRHFLLQRSVFLGFNDYQDGIWGEDYETEREYWQISYEWGRYLAQYCEIKNIKINWKERGTIPRALTDSVYGAIEDEYVVF